MTFGPKNADEAVEYAVQRLRADVQYAVLRALKEEGVTQAELARRVGCTPAAISQFLDDDANLTIESIAKLFLALGRECSVTSSQLKSSVSARDVEQSPSRRAAWREEGNDEAARSFIDTTALVRVLRSRQYSRRNTVWANDNMGSIVISEKAA